MKTNLLHIISIILLLGMGEVAVAANAGVSYVSPLKDDGCLSELRTHQGASLRNGVTVRDVRMTHDGPYFTVEMLLDLRNLDVDADRAVLLTPCLKNGADSVELPSVGIYGRRRYYHYLRSEAGMLSGTDEMSYRAKEKPDTLIYNKVIGYKEWMNGATLSLHRTEWGCCQSLLAESTDGVGEFAEAREFFPTLVYVQPKAEAAGKTRSLEGSAFIDFPVNKTEIHPDYRRNAAELGKIEATIDSVRSDRDVTITQVWLKGYASPEGGYANNERLALGRTEALKRYIGQLYQFPEGILLTDHEPEDWAGLRRYVEQSNLDHKVQILALIDSDMEADRKEQKIKSSYPADYRFLLRNCYPALRHTDYRIAYTVRTYTDVEEIKRVLKERPQNLSLNEFHLVAQTYEPGTDEFSEVYETAVRMYPTDKTANLNAANAAMRRGDLAGAARYLDRAGESPEAVYARGALAIRQGDIDTARRYLEEAERQGVEQAAKTLTELNNGRRE